MFCILPPSCCQEQPLANPYNLDVVVPGGGLDKPTDRDQQSWVFLTYPKKYFATYGTPKKILSEKQNPKKYPPKTPEVPGIKLQPKNTVQNMKHLKIQHYLTTLKNTAALGSTQKNTDLRNSKPKKYSADSCL